MDGKEMGELLIRALGLQMNIIRMIVRVKRLRMDGSIPGDVAPWMKREILNLLIERRI